MKVIAAVFIYGVGASYALYEGFQKLWQPPAAHRMKDKDERGAMNDEL